MGVTLEMVVGVALLLLEGVTLETLDGDVPALPPWPGNGPAIDVVIGACSTKTPDQYQSSAAAFVPPFGRRSSPTCQSAELDDGLQLMPDMICTSGAEPLDAQRPHVPPLKSMSYAKLYQLLATSCVLHCV